jgi:hypothetical protein
MTANDHHYDHPAQTARLDLLTELVNTSGRGWELTRYEAETCTVWLDHENAAAILAIVQAREARITRQSRCQLILDQHGPITIETALTDTASAILVAKTVLEYENGVTGRLAQHMAGERPAGVRGILLARADMHRTARVPFGQPIAISAHADTLGALIADKVAETNLSPGMRGAILAITTNPHLIVTAQLLTPETAPASPAPKPVPGAIRTITAAAGGKTSSVAPGTGLQV